MLEDENNREEDTVGDSLPGTRRNADPKVSLCLYTSYLFCEMLIAPFPQFWKEHFFPC